MALSVCVHQLSVNFAAPDGFTALPALGPLSICVPAGQFVAVVGPSGCGKSTLIRVLAGLEKLTDGEAHIDQRPIQQPSRSVGLMFQQPNLMPWRTVLENIALPLELAGIKRQERLDLAQAMIPLLGLEGFEWAYPAKLSGGMAQRAALGRVLIQQPEVLLLDEPFGALDAITRERISLDLLGMWEQNQPTVLMVTHDIQEAALLADRVLVLSRRPGRLIADIAVNLPRPRHLEQIYEPDFLAIAREVRAAIEAA